MTELEDIVEDNPNPKTWKHKLWNVTKMVLKLAVTSALLYYVFSKVPLSEVKNRLITCQLLVDVGRGCCLLLFDGSIVMAVAEFF